MLWMLVGIMLCLRGGYWIFADSHTSHLCFLILPLALLAGIVKSAWVLEKSAARTTARIRQLDERSPIWRLFSPTTYLLILGMMALGVACRWAGKHWHITGAVGILYLVVGIALLSGSRKYWMEE